MCKKSLLLKSVSQQQQKGRNKTPGRSGFVALGGIKVTSSDSLLTMQLGRENVCCSLSW